MCDDIKNIMYYISIERIGINSTTQANAEQICRDIKRFLKAIGYKDAVINLKSWDEYWGEQDLKSL